MRAEELAAVERDTEMTRRLLWREEANEEAEQKGRCNTELPTNELTRIEITNAVETVHAVIDQFDEDIIELNKAVADLDVATVIAASMWQADNSTKHTATV